MKKKNVLSAVLIFLSISIISAQKAENYKIKAFDNLTISGYFDIFIVQKADYSLKIKADDFVKNLLEIEQEENSLKIEVNVDGKDISFENHKATIWISAPEFSSLEINGALHLECENTLKMGNLDLTVNGAVRMEMDLNLEHLDAEINGANLVNFYGKVNSYNIELNGAGQVQADELKTKDATISISGAGKADVFASKTLNASIDGIGLIRYTGNPEKITQDISLLGALTEL